METDDKARKRALDKIRKCLALGNSSNEHEAEAALRQARKLMDKYQLEHADVLASQIEEHTLKVSDSSRAPPLWVILLSTLVAEAFGCVTIRKHAAHSGCRVVFIGPVGAGEMAAYAYAVLSRQMAQAKKAFQETLPDIGVGYKRRMGTRYSEQWIRAVYQKISQFAGVDEEAGKAIDAYMGSNFPDLKYTKTRQRKLKRDEYLAALAGQEDGEKASLHVPMGADAPVERIGVAEKC